MSELFDALRETPEGKEFSIQKEEVILLVEILGSIATALKQGTIQLNEEPIENEKLSDFCVLMAHRFANMKTENET